MKFTISEKVTFLFILLVVVLGVAFGFYFVRYQKETLLSEFDERVKVLLSGVAISSEYPVLIEDVENLDKIGKGALKQKDVVFCEISGKGERVLFQGGAKKNTRVHKYVVPIVTQRAVGKAQEDLILGFTQKKTERIGQVTLLLSIEGLIDRMNEVKRNIALLAIGGAAVALFLITLLIRFILGWPIHELTKGIERIAAGDLDYKVSIESTDELGQLADSFNKMTQDLHKITVSRGELIKEVKIRAHAEEVARRSEERFQDVASSTGEWIWEIDIEGRYCYSSPAVEKILGYKPEEIIGKHFYDSFLLGEQGQLRQPALEAMARKEVFQNFSNKNIRKDGNVVIIETSGVPIVGKDGELIGYRGVDRDITERSKAEKEKEVLIIQLQEHQELLNRQKQEAEESRRAIKNVAEDLRMSKEAIEEQKGSLESINKELDDFTYIISHDLKEPLRSIDAFSKFIVDDYKDKLDEQGRFYLERVRMNAARMQQLIEDLLELSRIERNKNILEEVPAAELIDEVKLRLEYRIQEKNARLTIQSALPTVYCDRVRLTEVFANLISNALKFNNSPAPLIEIGSRKEGYFYEFYVKDNGPGIEAQYFDKIFEIFQRLGKKEDSEGTGVGLTIVKKIIQMHKGKIRVESAVGEGATFYFTIPTKEKYFLNAGKKKIGEILVDKKLVSKEDVQKALEEQTG